MYILASASPRRRELISHIIDDFKVVVSEIEETCPEEIELFKRPEFLSVKKAEDIAIRYNDDIIISADTAVFLDDKMLGKPKNKEDAFLMLKSLSGRKHKVITGCCIIKGNKKHSFSVATDVEFYELTEREIEDYIAKNESFDKAGGYGIQGKGCVLVKGIEGDYFNVVGLPVAELHKQLVSFEKNA